MSRINPSACLFCLAALQQPAAKAGEQRITRAGEQASVAGLEQFFICPRRLSRPA